MAILYKDSLSFTFEFILDFGRVLPSLTFWTREADLKKESFLELRENVPVSAVFYSNTKTDSGQIEIETSRYDDMGEIEILMIPLQQTDAHIPVYKRERDTEFPWRMGYYVIKVHFNNSTYFTGIQVTPNNMNRDQVKLLHAFLEQRVEGLSYDLMQSQQGYAQELDLNSPDVWYFDYLRFLQDYRITIMGLLDWIEKNPYEVISSSYTVSSMQGKLSALSERWAGSSRGLAYNQGLLPQPFSYNMKKVLELNNPINRWLKHILLKWKRDLDEISLLFHRDIEHLEHEETELRAIQLEANQQQENNRNIKDMVEIYRKQFRQRFEDAEEKIRNIQVRKKVYGVYLKVLQSVQSRISYCLNLSFLSDMEEGRMKPFLKNRFYVQLDHLYSESKRIRKEEGDAKRYKPILKRTWQLYEYFVLIQIMDIIRRAGFRLSEGFDSVMMRRYHQQGIPEESRFILESEQAVIHVWYDKLLPLTPEDADQIGEHFYALQDHRRPDIRLDFYKRHGAGLQFSGCFVAEVKDSKFRNLYPQGYVNKIRTQLLAYSSIYYCGPNTAGREDIKYRPIVDRVYCVHSGEGISQDPRTQRAPITFIRLFPSLKNGENDIEVFGRDELESDLNEWIAKSII